MSTSASVAFSAESVTSVGQKPAIIMFVIHFSTCKLKLSLVKRNINQSVECLGLCFRQHYSGWKRTSVKITPQNIYLVAGLRSSYYQLNLFTTMIINLQLSISFQKLGLLVLMFTRMQQIRVVNSSHRCRHEHEHKKKKPTTL
jgi:hypothetical protein